MQINSAISQWHNKLKRIYLCWRTGTRAFQMGLSKVGKKMPFDTTFRRPNDIYYPPTKTLFAGRESDKRSLNLSRL